MAHEGQDFCPGSRRNREMLSRCASVFPQKREDADDGDRDRIGAKRAMTKRDETDASVVRALPLPFVPTAFRSDPDRDVGWRRFSLEHGDRFHLRVSVGLDEHQPQAAERLFEMAVETER